MNFQFLDALNSLLNILVYYFYLACILLFLRLQLQYLLLALIQLSKLSLSIPFLLIKLDLFVNLI